MSVELKMLCWSVLLGLVQVALAATLVTWQRGLRWNIGNRDGAQPPVTGAASRASRASRNFLETFVFFAVAVLVVEMTGRANAYTAIGAQLYFWARLVYVPVYVVGIPYLRTLVWAVSVWGLLQVFSALF